MEVKLDFTFRYQDSVPISWTRFGNINGPPLVFCHGTPWSSQLWAPIARCFASEFSVYLFDMPGYGQSMLPPEADFRPTYPAQTKAFCALLAHWRSLSGDGVFKPHVVAHDIGGHVALRALLMEDTSFSSLALVDCGASYPVDEPFFSLVRENAFSFTLLPSKLHEALLREYIRGASYCGLRKAQEDMLVQPWLSKEGQSGFYSQIAAQRNADIQELRQKFRNLDVALHIVWAQHDSWVPVERANKLQEVLGGSLKIITNAGHLIQLDAPEALTAELIAWLHIAQQPAG
ncbi:hypothetical protein MMC11_003755 [Xylographa trunciseda]|nr:hypothetical protein [Xylographa trunciseda]